MNTIERVADIRKEGLDYLNEQNKMVKQKQVSHQNKPKMYQKVREILSVVNSNFSKDVIEHRGE